MLPKSKTGAQGYDLTILMRHARVSHVLDGVRCNCAPFIIVYGSACAHLVGGGEVSAIPACDRLNS